MRDTEDHASTIVMCSGSLTHAKPRDVLVCRDHHPCAFKTAGQAFPRPTAFYRLTEGDALKCDASGPSVPFVLCSSAPR
jgi:hypothetical protein